MKTIVVALVVRSASERTSNRLVLCAINDVLGLTSDVSVIIEIKVQSLNHFIYLW